MLIDILNETEIAVDIHTSPPQYRVTLESNCPARGGISQLSFHYHQKRKEMMCACCVHPKGVKKYFVFFILFSLVYWQEAGDSPAMNNRQQGTLSRKECRSLPAPPHHSTVENFLQSPDIHIPLLLEQEINLGRVEQLKVWGLFVKVAEITPINIIDCLLMWMPCWIHLKIHDNSLHS